MSKSKLNIEELEKQFDAILASFDENEINKWYRFDQTMENLEKFFAGEFQPVEIADVEIARHEKKSVFSICDIEVFDYQLDHAC